MALIKCPECMKDISDKSEQCIHCGYPLLNIKKDVFTMNTKTTNDNLRDTPVFELKTGKQHLEVFDDCWLVYQQSGNSNIRQKEQKIFYSNATQVRTENNKNGELSLFLFVFKNNWRKHKVPFE